MPDADGPLRHHGERLTGREALLFEAGIKLGGLFHQYLGIPVASRTAPGLARTIEEAVRLQPYVEAISVTIDPQKGAGRLGPGRFGYRYLTAEMLNVRVRLAHGPTRVEAELAFRPDLDYPLMRVVGASRSAARGRRAPRRRSSR
ncbi:MAG: dihydroneopterin aldolase family protein [Thermoplasmata archaeon]